MNMRTANYENVVFALLTGLITNKRLRHQTFSFSTFALFVVKSMLYVRCGFAQPFNEQTLKTCCLHVINELRSITSFAAFEKIKAI